MKTGIQDVPYSHTTSEIAELQALLTHSYQVSLKPFNWRSAVFENWIYASRYLEPLKYFTQRVHLWRADTGELVAFTLVMLVAAVLVVVLDKRIGWFLKPEPLQWPPETFG